MPLYEYQCEQCGEQFEVMQKFSDTPVARHEKCGGPVHRLISAPALQFKGSGWYITDYAKGSNTSSNTSGNGSPGSKSDTNSSGKTGSDASSTTPAAGSSSSDSKSGSSSDTK